MQVDCKQQCKYCKCGQDMASAGIMNITTDYDEVPQRLSESHDAETGQRGTSETPSRIEAPKLSNQEYRFRDENQPAKRNGLDDDARIHRFKRCCTSYPCASSAPRGRTVGNIEAESILISWPTDMDQEVMVIPTCQGREVATMSCSSLRANKYRSQYQAFRSDAQFRCANRRNASDYRDFDRNLDRREDMGAMHDDRRGRGGYEGRLAAHNFCCKTWCRYDETSGNRLADRTRIGQADSQSPRGLGGMACNGILDGMCETARENLRLGEGIVDQAPVEEPLRQRSTPSSGFDDGGSDSGPCDEDFEPIDEANPGSYCEERENYIKDCEEGVEDDSWDYYQFGPIQGEIHRESNFSVHPLATNRMMRPLLIEGSQPNEQSSYKHQVTMVDTGTNTDVESENKFLSFLKKIFGKKKNKKNKKHVRHQIDPHT